MAIAEYFLSNPAEVYLPEPLINVILEYFMDCTLRKCPVAFD